MLVVPAVDVRSQVADQSPEAPHRTRVAHMSCAGSSRKTVPVASDLPTDYRPRPYFREP